jgi:hypothetical protein
MMSKRRLENEPREHPLCIVRFAYKCAQVYYSFWVRFAATIRGRNVNTLGSLESAVT